MRKVGFRVRITLWDNCSDDVAQTLKPQHRRHYIMPGVPSTHMDERVEAVRRRLLERGFTGIRRPDGTIAELNRDYLDLTHSF